MDDEDDRYTHFFKACRSEFAGIPVNVVRTFSENAATLKFDQFAFEEE